MPDDELMALAEKHQLGKPDMLRSAGRSNARRSEIGRVRQELRRPMARTCATSKPPSRARFCIPNSTTCSRRRWSRETELFFDEVLKHDLSLTNFIDSDFSMLNGRLAKHLRHSRRRRLGIPQGAVARGFAIAAGC